MSEDFRIRARHSSDSNRSNNYDLAPVCQLTLSISGMPGFPTLAWLFTSDRRGPPIPPVAALSRSAFHVMID